MIGTKQTVASRNGEPDAFPAWKTATIIGIVLACFAIIYPKFLQPIFHTGSTSQDLSFEGMYKEINFTILAC